MTVVIIGFGWVGKAMHRLFPDALVYDIRPLSPESECCDPPLKPEQIATSLSDVGSCDVAFVCVPTPEKKGVLDCSAVEEVVRDCKCDLFIIRSTVQPGTCDYLKAKYGKRIVMHPEYIGETPNHPMLDPRARPFMILGGDKKDTRSAIEIYQRVYNANITIRQVSCLEAEVIKLSENRAIAFKVAQCQELYDVCEKAGLDYYTIRDAVYGDDPRFNLWFTFVYPHKRGFNSKCLPKDVIAWCAWAESVGYYPKLTRALLEVNEAYIRSQSTETPQSTELQNKP